MDFSAALLAVKSGQKIARSGWNGKGMYLYFVPGSTFSADRPPISDFVGTGTEVSYRDHIDMKTADGSFVPWVASQTDLLAGDWETIE